MPLPFEIPDPEQYLPRATPGAPPLAYSTPDDPSMTALQDLLSSLENPTVPQPQQPRQWQRVLGALGDALGSMASVRAGGAPQPVGPFAANLRAQQSAYEQQQREAEQMGMETRNRVRIGAFEEEQRLKREKEVASVRAMQKQRAFQLKQFQATDENGRPIMIPYNYNPNFGTLAPAPGYEQGFDRYVRPFLAQGINTETGEMEFRLLDPFSGSGIGRSQAGGAPPAGDRTGAGDKKVKGFEPKPTAGEIESAEAGTVIQDQLRAFKDLASQYRGGERIAGTARATGQGIVRALPLIGKPLSEALGDSEYEELTAFRGRIGQQLARLVENGRLSDQDRDFALENLPTVESLTTETGRQTAAAKIALVEREIETRLARRRQLRPGLMRGTGGPPTGQYAGRSLPASSFDRLPPDRREAEKQRFIAAGGVIIEGQ